MPIERVLDFYEKADYDGLSPNVVMMAKKSLLDFLAAAFAGHQNKVSEITLPVMDLLGGEGTCTVIGTEKKMAPLAAAFLNATFSSCLDIDDGHRQAVGHPGCMIIPPVLATCELVSSSSGKELITAMVTGYEIGIRCGIVMNSNYNTLFYGSGGWGHFGSAVGAAKVKRMTGDPVKHALTIGEVYGPTAQCGKSIAAGSMTKESVSWGVTTGLMGTFLAEVGLTGPNNILLDEHLYGIHAKKVFQTLGEVYEIENIYFKQYPACKWAHSPIAAARAIKEEHQIDVGDIDEIIIEIFRKATTLDHIAPETSEAAQYSIPFTVATALLYGNVEPYHVSEKNLRNEAIHTIGKKIRLQQVDDLEKMFPEKRPARLRVIMRDGSIFEKEKHIVKGDAEEPLTWEELIHKFKMCSKDILSTESQLNIIDHIEHLEQLQDVKELTNLLSV